MRGDARRSVSAPDCQMGKIEGALLALFNVDPHKFALDAA